MSYPVRRTIYCKTVGKTRVENIVNILQRLGFVAVAGETENDDVDIWVYKDYSLVLVIEVLNWKRKIYMDHNRAMAIRENFSNSYYHSSRKLLVFSFIENIRNRLDYLMEGLNIDLIELGFQTQPYYSFYATVGLADGMRPNTIATKNLVREKLEAYLRETGLA